MKASHSIAPPPALRLLSGRAEEVGGRVPNIKLPTG